MITREKVFKETEQGEIALFDVKNLILQVSQKKE